MKRRYITSTDLNRYRSPSIWVTIHEYMIRGDEVIITHYGKPVARIIPYVEGEK